MNFTHNPTGPDSSPQAQQALESMAAQSRISPRVPKRKQSDVEVSDGWQAQNFQRTHITNLGQFAPFPTITGTGQIDESRSGDVCDLQNCQESAAGSLQASYGDAGYLSVSPVIKPQAQLIQGESQEGIVNSGLGGHLDSQIVPIEKTRSPMKRTESEWKARRTDSQEDETRPPNQAKEGIQMRLKRQTWQRLEHKSVSHSRVNYPTSSSKPTKSCTFGAHPYGDTLAKQAQYLLRVSSLNARLISRQVHKSFLQRERLDIFANLNWQIQDYEDLHEIIENYDEKMLTSRWHSEVIDLSDDALARIFPLPRSTKVPLLKVTSFRSELFPDGAMRNNGFLLSQCIDPLIVERLKFLWETVHVKKVTPVIPYYMVRLFQETSTEKNWFEYFLYGFRKGLTKALTNEFVRLGSHLRLVLADHAPLVANVCASCTREESTERKATFLNCDATESEVLEGEGQTLQAEGQASEAKHLTQVIEGVPESTLFILPCASRGDPSSSINDLATRNNLSFDVGAIANLLKCLAANDNPNLQRHVVAVLSNLADFHNSVLVNQIAHKAGAIDVVLKGLSGDCVLQLHTARLLANLTYEDAIKSQFPKEEGMRILLKCLSANERPYVQEEVAKVLRNLTREGNFVESHIFNEVGGAAILLKCMSRRYKKMPYFQEDAAAVLAALARGDSSVVNQIANEAGALDILFKCLSADDKPGLQEAAARVLATLTRKYRLRSEIANYEEALPMLLRCLSPDCKRSVRQQVAAVLENLTSEDSIKSQFPKEDGIPILLKWLSANEWPCLKRKLAKVLRNLYGSEFDEDMEEVCAIFGESDGVAILLKCMSERYKKMPDLQEDAATVLAFLAHGHPLVACGIANEAGAINILLKCSSADDKPGLQEQAASVLASSTLDCTVRLQIANNDEVISMLLRCLSADNKPRLQEVGADGLEVLTRDDGFVQSQFSKHVGAIANLLKCLAANDNPTLQVSLANLFENLANAFENLAAKDSSVLGLQIANEAGTIDVVRKGLSGDCVLQLRAGGLLANLTCEDSIKSQFPKDVVVPIMLNCLSPDGRRLAQKNIARVLRILTRKDDYAVSDIFQGGATILLKCMSETYEKMPDLQEDAAIVLTACGDSSVGNQIANEARAIDIHLKWLSSDNKPGLLTEAASVLASSADESRLSSQIGNTEEAIPMLLRYLSADYKPSELEEAARWLASLTCEDSMLSQFPKEEGIRILLKCLSANERPYVHENVAKVLRNLSREDDFIESHIFIEAGGAAILLKCMSERYKMIPDLQEDAATVLAALARGDSSVGNQIANEAGAIDILLKCLSEDDKPGLQEAAANVLASSAREDRFTAEIAHNKEAIPMLLRCLSADYKPSVQEEVARLLANLTCYGSMMSQFPKEEGIRILLKCLSANERPYVHENVAKVLRNLTRVDDFEDDIEVFRIFKEAGGATILRKCMSKRCNKMPGLQKAAATVLAFFARGDS